MSWLSHLSVRAKLALLVGMLSLGIVVVSVASLWGLREAVSASQHLVKTEVAAVRTLGDTRAAVGNMRRFEKDMFLNLADEEALASFHNAWQKQVADALDHLAGLKPNLPAQDQDAAGRMAAAIDNYRKTVEEIFNGITTGNVNDPWAANKAMEPARSDILATDESFTKISAAVTRRVDGTVEALASLRTTAMALTAAVAGSVLVLCMVLGYLIAAQIAHPLRLAVTAIERVASGDLTGTVSVQGSDETSRVLGGIDKMRQSLVLMVSDIRQGVASMLNASSDIASGNQNLSSRTEQAASNLQQTAASMEQLTSTVRQSASAAHEANQFAASAAGIAERGGQVVSQVVARMDEINHSSKKIGDIIGVIDGIAFQTNILALNAAVEAARAGEQGRGFAVVAAEVRNLAQRSAEAAKEIKVLIGASVDKVETGSRLVTDAGQTMSEIVDSVQRVSDIIGEITAAASEQSDGIGQVNAAVNQLDQMTQQNAALVEQSAAAAESLKDQAQRLNHSMARFRVSLNPV